MIFASQVGFSIINANLFCYTKNIRKPEDFDKKLVFEASLLSILHGLNNESVYRRMNKRHYGIFAFGSGIYTVGKLCEILYIKNDFLYIKKRR